MNKLKQEHNELKAITNALEYDINGLLSGTKTAATSSRAKLLALSKICSRMRKTCMDAKTEIPSRSRAKKSAVPIEQKTQQAAPPSDDDSDEEDTLTQQFERKVAVEKVKRSKKGKRSKRGMRIGV
jgi:hypothetical protein